MAPVRLVAIYCGIVFLGGALLAPWLYWAIHGAGPPGELAPDGAGEPFHRYVHRAILALALLGVWPLVRRLKMNARDLGLVPVQLSRVGAGYTIGFVSLAVVALLAIAVGARRLEPISPNMLAGTIALAALSAILVAVLEEILFRGALFGVLRTGQPIPVAIFLSSLLYATVHFFDRPPPPVAVKWYSGFTTLLTMLAGFVDIERLVPGIFCLLLAGVILASAYQRTGTLYFSIGLHAGWIFWLKLYRALTMPNGEMNASFWGTTKMIDGWLAVCTMGVLCFCLNAWYRRFWKDSHVV